MHERGVKPLYIHTKSLTAFAFCAATAKCNIDTPEIPYPLPFLPAHCRYGGSLLNIKGPVKTFKLAP